MKNIGKIVAIATISVLGVIGVVSAEAQKAPKPSECSRAIWQYPGTRAIHRGNCTTGTKAFFEALEKSFADIHGRYGFEIPRGNFLWFRLPPMRKWIEQNHKM